MKSKVALDPGHGGSDPGASVVINGVRLTEAEVALLLARRIKEEFYRAGIEVVWTRWQDGQSKSLPDRVMTAVNSKVNAFVSVHCNSGNPKAQGFEVFYPARHSESKKLAETIANTFRETFPTLRLRGAKPDTQTARRSVYVLRSSASAGIPAVLMECGFITNQHDRELMLNPDYGLKLGHVVAVALKETVCR